MMRLDSDVPPRLPHSEDPSVAVSSRGRVHVAWLDSPSGLGDSDLQHVALGAEPTVTATLVRPATTCRATIRLEVASPAALDCPGATIQWFVDGTAAPGATDLAFEVPRDLPAGAHAFHYEVACADPLPCGGVSVPLPLVLEAVPNDVVDGAIAGLLMVSRSAAGLELRWTDAAPESQGHAVYAGTIASLFTGRAYDHAPLACGVAVPARSLTTPMPAAGTYYLVTPQGCVDEGLAGSDSFGRARPVAGSGAPCGALR
jgi:hypothetical protein